MRHPFAWVFVCAACGAGCGGQVPREERGPACTCDPGRLLHELPTGQHPGRRRVRAAAHRRRPGLLHHRMQSQLSLQLRAAGTASCVQGARRGRGGDLRVRTRPPPASELGGGLDPCSVGCGGVESRFPAWARDRRRPSVAALDTRSPQPLPRGPLTPWRRRSQPTTAEPPRPAVATAEDGTRPARRNAAPPPRRWPRASGRFRSASSSPKTVTSSASTTPPRPC